MTYTQSELDDARLSLERGALSARECKILLAEQAKGLEVCRQLAWRIEAEGGHGYPVHELARQALVALKLLE